MENLNWVLSGVKPSELPLRAQTARREAVSRELSVMQVGDFVTLMKLVAEHDLWDDLEMELAGQGCSNFRISALPMRLVSGYVRRQVATGVLPNETLETLSAASCVLCPPITGVGRVVNSDGTVPSLKPGTSQGDPQDGGVGSEDKPQ